MAMGIALRGAVISAQGGVWGGIEEIGVAVAHQVEEVVLQIDVDQIRLIAAHHRYYAGTNIGKIDQREFLASHVHVVDLTAGELDLETAH